MKTRRIDEFGDEYYYCDRCGEAVDEYDDYCDICGNNLSSTSIHFFNNKRQAEDFCKNSYKIINIRKILDKCLIVEANPVSIESFGIFFTSHICDETLRFIYPNTQENLEYLINIAKKSLLEIDFNDFMYIITTIDGSYGLMYRNKIISDKRYYNGVIDSSSMEKIDSEQKQENFFKKIFGKKEIRKERYKIYLPNYDCYVGEIQDSIISGWGEYYFAIQGNAISASECSRHLGFYKDGLPNGIGVFVSENRPSEFPKIEEWGYFLNGKKNGVCLCIYRDGIPELGIYHDDKKSKDLSAEFVKTVGINIFSKLNNDKREIVHKEFWYNKRGIWIGTLPLDKTGVYNGLLILDNGDCYMGTMPNGFKRRKIVGIKVLSNGTIESGEWILDV